MRIDWNNWYYCQYTWSAKARRSTWLSVMLEAEHYLPARITLSASGTSSSICQASLKCPLLLFIALVFSRKTSVFTCLCCLRPSLRVTLCHGLGLSGGPTALCLCLSTSLSSSLKASSPEAVPSHPHPHSSANLLFYLHFINALNSYTP